VKRLTLLLLLAGAPALTGCLPMMALSAADLAARSAQGTPVSNESLAPQARDACTAHAAQYGTVNVIDVEQHRVNEIIVWGTVGEGAQKRSFECDFGTKISGFKLRPITTEH
jgi:hypothetical protein